MSNEKKKAASQTQSIKSLSGISDLTDIDRENIDFAKKIHQKDQEIEELKKTLRFLEYTHKKALIEKQNELEFERLKLQNLSKSLHDQPLFKLASELEKKLADKEEEVFSIKDTLFSLRRELTDVKQKNLQLKNSNKKLTNMSLIGHKVAKNFSISVSPQKTSLILKREGGRMEEGWRKEGRKDEGEKKGEERTMPEKEEEGGKKRDASMGGRMLEMIDERDEILKEKGKGVSNEILFNCIKRLQEEKQLLSENIIMIKESAIETIVEKEKDLIDCQAKLEESQSFYKNDSDLLKNEIQLLKSKIAFYEENKCNTAITEMANLQVNFESLQTLFNQEKIAFELEKDRLQSKINELLQMNEDQESEFNIKMEKVNEEIETQIHMKILKDTEISQEKTLNLLHELQEYDEKCRNLEKKLINSQYELKSIFGRSEKEGEELRSQIAQLQSELNIKEEKLKQSMDAERKLSSEHKSLLLTLEQKSSSLLQLESMKLQTSKKLALLENDVSQLKMRENLYKESISNLKAELEEERSKRDEEGRKWRDLVEEGEERLMREKARLEIEIRKCRDDEESKNAILHSNPLVEELSPHESTNQSPCSLQKYPSTVSPRIRVSILEPLEEEEREVEKREEGKWRNHEGLTEEEGGWWKEKQEGRREEAEQRKEEGWRKKERGGMTEEGDWWIEEEREKNEEGEEEEGENNEKEEGWENRRIEELELMVGYMEEGVERMKKNFEGEINRLMEEKMNDMKEIQRLRQLQITDSTSTTSSAMLSLRSEILAKEEIIQKLTSEMKENNEIWENERNFALEERRRLEELLKNQKLKLMKTEEEKEKYAKKFAQIYEYYKKQKEKEKKNEGGLFGFNLSFFRR